MIYLDRVTGITEDDKEVLTEIYNHVVVKYYNRFDKGHDAKHLDTVVNNAITIREALDYRDEIDYMIMITAAMYHDVGLVNGRRSHHVMSYNIANKCPMLRRHFDDKAIRTISRTCMEHRSNSGFKRNCVISMIVADADSLNNIEDMIYRSFHYNKGGKGKLELVYHHLAEEKYGRNGYHKFILNETKRIFEHSLEIPKYLENKSLFTKVYKNVTGFEY